VAKRPDKPADLVGRLLTDFEKDLKPHAGYVQNVDRWYRAYRGIAEIRSKSVEWTSKLHPAYGFQVIETLVASVVDPNVQWRVRGRPRMDQPDAIARLNAGIRANEILLSEQVDEDQFAAKQLLFAKQAFIAQMSVYKTRWEYNERDVPEQALVYQQYQGVQVPRLGTKKRRRIEDRPTVDVVDVRDIFFQEGSVSLDRAGRVTHRVWYSYDELLQLEAQGVYGVRANGQPVSLLKESRDYSTSSGNSDRENDLFGEDRTKGKIEVLEQWRREADGTISVVSVGNRKVLLRDTPSPFWHGELPFVVCAPVPDLGRIPGVSIVELIAELQEAAWSFLNQRIDMTEILVTPPFLIAEDFEGDLDWGPGAQNVVQRPEQVEMMQINPMPSEVSLKAEELIKQDLQNIPGASPTLLGQTDPSAQTATEISVTTTLAQKRIGLMKQQFKWAEKKVGEQWLKMNQQFITEPRLVQVTGMDGAVAFEEVRPLMLQGDYFIEMEAMDESLVKQQNLAEATSRLQIAQQATQFFAALPGQPNINLQAFMDDVLRAAGINDTQRYYSPKQPMNPVPGAQAQPAQQQQGNGIAPQGVTAPQSIDINSPSNAFSQSPAAATQRLGAMSGGPSNA
jgi:hypothetical protein